MNKSEKGILKSAYFDKARMSIVLNVDINGREAQCNIPADTFSYRPGQDKEEELIKTVHLFNNRKGMVLTLSTE